MAASVDRSVNGSSSESASSVGFGLSVEVDDVGAPSLMLIDGVFVESTIADEPSSLVDPLIGVAVEYNCQLLLSLYLLLSQDLNDDVVSVSEEQ